MPFSIDTFLRDLTRVPHRGTASVHEKTTINLLLSTLRDQRAETSVEAFHTPRTYVSVVYWLIGGLLVGLLGFPYLKTFSVLLTWLCTAGAWLYFNWRYSPVIALPPWVTSYNVVGRWRDDSRDQQTALKIILMAHYDTAPVSLLYRTGSVSNFRGSLVVSLVFMLLASIVVIANLFEPDSANYFYLRCTLAGYFLLQAILGTLGFWLYGYTNGASDNATGVAAAIATAEKLRQASLPGLDIEVVLTGAEEAGMIGAYHYLEKHINEWPRHRTAVVNFDTLGNGHLTLIRQTGTVETILYDNDLYKQAEKLMNERQFRNLITPGVWHTADFDSVWFVRAGVPVITLTALDEQGQMPHIHRKEDQLLNTDLSAVPVAVDFAAQTLVRLYQSRTTVKA